MTLSINTNVSSLLAQQTLSNNSTQLAGTLQRLATGLKINSAADNSAGYAIAQLQTATINALKQGMDNGNDGESMMQVAGSAIQSITD
ncbi:MAG: flagellin, partial [Legionellales bacterium]